MNNSDSAADRGWRDRQNVSICAIIGDNNEMFWSDLILEIFKKDNLIISPGKCEITRQHEQRFEK
jgi:hypothetical protein